MVTFPLEHNISNCVPDCTVNTGTIKITSSSFNNNGDAAGNNHVGLYLFSKGAITLNGVSASNNKGDGLDVEFRGPLTIKNSVFANNIADPVNDYCGYGIYTYSTSTGNLIIENSVIANNGNEGALIRTLGNVTLKKVNAFSNGASGIFIVKSESDWSEGANNVIVIDSSFWDNANTNLSIRAKGMVTITNLYSSHALLSGRGLTIDNSFATLPKSIYYQ